MGGQAKKFAKSLGITPPAGRSCSVKIMISQRCLLLAPLLAFLPLEAAPSSSTEVVALSGPERTSLLELFTSEGCSSCPPAEKWMASLVDDSRLWKSFVPVAFHVDYWDHLGWRDALARPEFTSRQRSHAKEWRAPSVYTPAFVLDGREWRSRELPASATHDAPGRLVVEQRTANRFDVTFDPSGDFSGGTASLAILGFDQKSAVRSGENAGRQLTHQFVAMQLNHSELSKDGKTNQWSASFTLPALPADRRLAIGAWISKTNSPVPIQAAGGWLSSNP